MEYRAEIAALVDEDAQLGYPDTSLYRCCTR